MAVSASRCPLLVKGLWTRKEGGECPLVKMSSEQLRLDFDRELRRKIEAGVQSNNREKRIDAKFASCG